MARARRTHSPWWVLVFIIFVGGGVGSVIPGGGGRGRRKGLGHAPPRVGSSAFGSSAFDVSSGQWGGGRRRSGRPRRSRPGPHAVRMSRLPGFAPRSRPRSPGPGARRGGLDQGRGGGRAKAAALIAAFELGRRAHGPAPASRYAIRTPEDAARLLLPLMRYLDREHFRAVLLNTKHEVMAVAEVAVGNLDSAPIHPREGFKEAVRRSAAAGIVAR